VLLLKMATLPSGIATLFLLRPLAVIAVLTSLVTSLLIVTIPAPFLCQRRAYYQNSGYDQRQRTLCFRGNGIHI
jgi:hypothetical protein